MHDSLCSTLPDAAAVNCVVKRCATSSTTREVSACDLLTCSRMIPSMDPAVCSAVASACSATFRVASVAVATWLAPDAADDAIWAANCAWRCAIVNPTGEADCVRRMHTRAPVLVSVGDCTCRILNAIFGAIVLADASAYPDMLGNAVVPCGTTDEAVSSTSAGAFCYPLCLLTVDWAFDAYNMLNLH